MQKAIDNSIKSSPFVMPSKFTCTHLGAVMVEEDFNKNEAIKIFNPKEFDKTDYGNKNIIVLGGASMPNEHVNNIKKALEDLGNEINDEDEIIFEGRKRDNDIKNPIPKEDKSAKQRLADMINDDSFWD